LDWIDLAQNENRQQVLVSIGMNHRISRKCGELPEQLSDYQLLKQGSVPQVIYVASWDLVGKCMVALSNNFVVLSSYTFIPSLSKLSLKLPKCLHNKPRSFAYITCDSQWRHSPCAMYFKQITYEQT
jgi:hypothetical protein